jgi:hypothetical protein
VRWSGRLAQLLFPGWLRIARTASTVAYTLASDPSSRKKAFDRRDRPFRPWSVLAVAQAAASWWALQDSNLRPLLCESGPGSRQAYTSLIKSSQPLEMAQSAGSDLRLDLAPFSQRLGRN